MKEAEEAFAEALEIRRKLAEANPDAYLPYVASTLNNLANLYRATQRMKDADRPTPRRWQRIASWPRPIPTHTCPTSQLR